MTSDADRPTLPAIVLPAVVVLSSMALTLPVSDAAGAAAVDEAARAEHLVLLVPAHPEAEGRPLQERLLPAGVVARLERVSQSGPTERGVLVRALHRAVLGQLVQEQPSLRFTYEARPDPQAEAGEPERYRRRIEAAGMPEEARREALREVARLERMPPQAAEYGVIKTYLDWLVELPWQRADPGEIDIARARAVLDEDNYDLQEIKERILEHLAVRKLRSQRGGGPGADDAVILCFVGPPGTGKTSLGQSIARALGRKFTRMSLGGIRDEAEIRGHRRTYVGAMPGRIIQAIRRVGTNNPVFTGHLGEVMKESAQIALSYVRSAGWVLGVDPALLRGHEVHIHVPAGATPKDGPSAGLAMVAALVSLLSGRPVRPDVAMTGEIALKGQVLPVGGIRQKLLAAQRAGLRTVLLPARNTAEMREIPEEVRAAPRSAIRWPVRALAWGCRCRP